MISSLKFSRELLVTAMNIHLIMNMKKVSTSTLRGNSFRQTHLEEGVGLRGIHHDIAGPANGYSNKCYGEITGCRELLVWVKTRNVKLGTHTASIAIK